MSNMQINPAWQHAQIANEGGEGYNPHAKWIVRQVAPITARRSAPVVRMLRDERGNLIGSDKLATLLAKDEARLLKITDASARALTEKSINHARQQLGI